MKENLKRYWFEFEYATAWDLPPGIGIGCGLNAFDFGDAVQIINEKVFANRKMPKINKSVENIDIRDLDELHVIPNMKQSVQRGIWFPLGYD